MYWLPEPIHLPIPRAPTLAAPAPRHRPSRPRCTSPVDKSSNIAIAQRIAQRIAASRPAFEPQPQPAAVPPRAARWSETAVRRHSVLTARTELDPAQLEPMRRGCLRPRARSRLSSLT